MEGDREGRSNAKIESPVDVISRLHFRSHSLILDSSNLLISYHFLSLRPGPQLGSEQPMPKPNKSSASSGTRKKHAKKAAGQDDPDGPGQQKRKPQRGEKKLSKAQKRAQPKIKQYVPPPKPPAPPIPDPLDGQGLARTLPADLVVILRRLGKKDDVTRRKGLDELKEWVEGIKTEQDEVEKETKEVTLTSAVPVWVSIPLRGT